MEPAAKNYLTESRQAKDARMQWWRQARFDMFIHWGVYADLADLQKYIAYMKAQVKELITEYDPAVLWFDGEWENTWNHKEGLKLYNYVRSLKPDIIINNRVDKGRKGMQGMTRDDTFAGDFGTPEQEHTSPKNQRICSLRQRMMPFTLSLLTGRKPNFSLICRNPRPIPLLHCLAAMVI